MRTAGYPHRATALVSGPHRYPALGISLRHRGFTSARSVHLSDSTAACGGPFSGERAPSPVPRPLPHRGRHTMLPRYVRSDDCRREVPPRSRIVPDQRRTPRHRRNRRHRTPDDEWRITDFSILDAETVKQINLGIFEEGEDDEYGWVKGDPSLTERRIRNVKEFQINRVMREFPTNEPLPQQCAHWMRAFSGLHFFPDANHRTGMNTLQILVEESDYPGSLPISEDIERFVLQSKLTRHLNSKIRFNRLWKRDAHYALWHQYFRNLLCDVPDRHPITPSDDQLRQTLHYARELGEDTDDGRMT